jgi:hypothetical protein
MSEHGHGPGHDDWHNDCHEFGYHCNCDCDEKNYGNRSSGTGGGMSTIGAILITIASFVVLALLFMVFGVDVEKIPGIVLIIMLYIVVFIISMICVIFGIW